MQLASRGLFRLNSGERLDDFDTEDEAMAAAEAHVRVLAERLAERAGTGHARIETERQVKVATIEGKRSFVEAIVTGRPCKVS